MNRKFSLIWHDDYGDNSVDDDEDDGDGDGDKDDGQPVEKDDELLAGGSNLRIRMRDCSTAKLSQTDDGDDDHENAIAVNIHYVQISTSLKKRDWMGKIPNLGPGGSADLIPLMTFFRELKI